jgi:flagellar capping protein FliD
MLEFKDKMSSKWDTNAQTIQEIKDFMRHELDKADLKVNEIQKRIDRDLGELKKKLSPMEGSVH